jgi:predicted PurR-regulated permease PerM
VSYEPPTAGSQGAMAAVDEPRITTPRPPEGTEARAGASGPRAQRGGPDEDTRMVRVPRLLVAASELSWRLIVCTAAVAIVVYALSHVGFAIVPVIVALLLSTLFVPPARRLHRLGVPQALATVTVFLTGLLLIAGLIALLAPPVASQVDALSESVRGGADEVGSYLADLPLGLSEREIQQQIDRLDDRIRDNQDTLRSGVISGAQAAGQFLAGLLIMLVVLFFFVKDGAGMWRWFVGLFPGPRRPAVHEVGQRSWTVLTAYVRGVVLVATIDAVGIGLALWLIGVPLVLPLAVITFVLAFIPFVGAITAGALAALVALVAVGPLAALLTVVAVLVVQQVEGNILYPLIVGRTVHIHPVAILLAVTVGGLLYGIVGAALAVPIATVMAAAVKVVDRHSVHGEVPVGPAPTPGEPG